MQYETFLARLSKCNLSELSRQSHVPLRTIRRILNNGVTPRAATMDRLIPHLKECKR